MSDQDQAVTDQSKFDEKRGVSNSHLIEYLLAGLGALFALLVLFQTFKKSNPWDRTDSKY